jgi:hypothetical protein
MYLETEHLRAEVAESRAKMAAVASTSGIGSREAKDLRDALAGARNESEKWRSEAARLRVKTERANRRAEEAERLFHSSRGVASHHPLPEEELDTAEGESGGDPRGDDDVEPRRAARRDNQLVDQRRRHHAPRGDRMLLTPWATLRGRVGAIVTGTGHHGPRRVDPSGGTRGMRLRPRVGRHADRDTAGAMVPVWSGTPSRAAQSPRRGRKDGESDNAAAEALARHLRAGGGSATLSSVAESEAPEGGSETRQVALPRGTTPYAPYVEGRHGEPAYGYSAYGAQDPRAGDFQ